ncbi:MAG: N-acetylmuramoyl-L-alanine amidase [Pseudomonadota bacterium]|nr:N-acetylmuramoyl-L-alanine amidase [Pseudomonadota bacterium]
MARCPFAVWMPITGPSGSHLGGPFKIVHHTTEGSTAQGAFNAFRKNRSDPHFTVDATTIFQHVDTAMGARALRNDAGGVQTNRDGAIQIELVAFAHLPKDTRALINVARLCRWLEATHQIQRDWPSGFPRPAKNGKDPGSHNRDATTWDTKSGHYGHCHVPENTHWDPGYTLDEVNFLMSASFDDSGRVVSERRAALAGVRRAPKAAIAKALKTAKSTMPDHSLVPVGVSAYLRDLNLSPPVMRATGRAATLKRAATPKKRRAATTQAKDNGVINAGSLVSFVAGVSAQEQEDVLYSVQLAQRAASGSFDRFTQTRFWYQKYLEVLENLGWAGEQLAFSQFDQDQGEFRMDQAALAVIAAIATQNQLAVLKASVDALGNLAEEDGTIQLFDFHSSQESSGNFQLGAVQKSNGALTMAVGAFYFHALDTRRRFLFFKWGRQRVNFWTAAQRLTLNTDFYAGRRATVKARIEADADDYLSRLVLG